MNVREYMDATEAAMAEFEKSVMVAREKLDSALRDARTEFMGGVAIESAEAMSPRREPGR